MLCGMGLFAETLILTGDAYGYTWTFKLLDGLSAAITSCSPEPHGDLKIPSELTLNEEISPRPGSRSRDAIAAQRRLLLRLNLW